MHGFNSGPTSIKGRQLGDAIAALPEAARPEYYLPQLAHRPAQAMRMVRRWADAGDRDRLTFVGSSLGGFYATHLAEAYEAKAVLINPAVHPDRDLGPYLGPQRNPYTGEAYELTAGHFAELSAFKVARIARPQHYLLLVQTGDEVLDYRVAVAFYAGAWQFVRGGGDHAFHDFAAQLPVVLRFAGIDAAAVERQRAWPA